MRLWDALGGLCLGAAALAVAGQAHALIIGTGTEINGFPFVTQAPPNGRYQQVYASSDFPGPITVSSISFFAIQAPESQFNTADYTVTLSTTQKVVGALDTVDLHNNPGPDAALFASFSLHGETVGTRFDVVARTGHEFAYDPSLGNLLIDIELFNSTAGGRTGGFDSYGGDSGSLFSRAQNFGGGSIGFGMNTGFNVSGSIPEPATLALLGFGLAGLGFVRRRRNPTLPAHPAMMLTAREMTSAAITRESVACTAINPFAQRARGMVSVGEKAVWFVNDR